MDVVEWLLDSEPAIRWQVMLDLTDAAEEHVAAERARVASEGWGARLLAEQMSDGGWNCEQENGSTLGSFHTTINVLEGLLEYERTVGSVRDVTAARRLGQEYLLERRMLRRLSTGEVIDQDRKTHRPAAWTQFSYPTYWHYDVLRGLDYLRAAGAIPDERVAEAIDLVDSKRDSDGRWPLAHPHPGQLHLALHVGQGRPSRWNTLRAMRVLRWYEPTPQSVSSGSGSASTG